MTSYRKINTTREKIIKERVTFLSNKCCRIRIILGEKSHAFGWAICRHKKTKKAHGIFASGRAECSHKKKKTWNFDITGSFLFLSEESNIKIYIKFVCKEVTVKSLKYCNWYVVVCMLVSLLIWQKVNDALPTSLFPLVFRGYFHKMVKR